MHGNAGRFVHDNELIRLLDNRSRPVHRVCRKAFGVDVDSNVFPGRQGTIGQDSLAVVIDGTKNKKPLCLIWRQCNAMDKEFQESRFTIAEVMPNPIHTCYRTISSSGFPAT